MSNARLLAVTLRVFEEGGSLRVRFRAGDSAFDAGVTACEPDKSATKIGSFKRSVVALEMQVMNAYEIVSHLPDDAVVTFHNANWDDYEDLLERVGEANHLRISYDDGVLQVMTLSSKHEKYARFLEWMVAAIALRLEIDILSFGSMTMRKSKQQKGNEPDACFYVQNAGRIGNKDELDFSTDPPPDVAVEVDLHGDSRNKLDIYAGLGIPEVWRFDSVMLTIHLLDGGLYRESATSQALPFLTSTLLTDFLVRFRIEGRTAAIKAFDEWLQTVRQP